MTIDSHSLNYWFLIKIPPILYLQKLDTKVMETNLLSTLTSTAIKIFHSYNFPRCFRSSTSVGVSLGAHLVCARVGLTEKQRAMCRSSPAAVAAVGDGLRYVFAIYFFKKCTYQYVRKIKRCNIEPAKRKELEEQRSEC